MSRPKKDTVQVTLRIPRKWLAKLDRIAVQLSKNADLAYSRTDAIRYAMILGMGARQG